MKYNVFTNLYTKLNTPHVKPMFCFLMASLFLFTSCEQKDNFKTVESSTKVKTSMLEEKPIKPKYDTKHPYGGWSCPDNLRGFPPVDLQQLDQVPVVNGRLPTEAEAKNGTSLLYFDKAKYPNARPLEMTMPRLARYYSEYTKKNELVIVIQAVVSDQDTLVGFRYLNGGNGSAWFGEVSFISDEEIDQLGSTPFVSINSGINAPKEKIWEVITSPKYAKSLGEMFDKNAFVESDWKNNSKVYFKYAPDSLVSTGIITALWEHLYIQVDYNFDGYHYAQKFLIMENANSNSTQLHIVSGPYGADYMAQLTAWNKWFNKVKEMSEELYWLKF